jgi:hypothetical protein
MDLAQGSGLDSSIASNSGSGISIFAIGKQCMHQVKSSDNQETRGK